MAGIISIHALREESDSYFIPAVQGQESFLSTLSVRRATMGSVLCTPPLNYFYPRSP